MNNPMDICCAYLYIISRYGYPPPVADTVKHIGAMAALGFSSIELEGIGKENIQYLLRNKTAVRDVLEKHGCSVPVFCVVLPQLGGDLTASERAECLESFEMGCETAKFFGAEGVLDNGPLLPLQYPADMPVMRHYSGAEMDALLPLPASKWEHYWGQLTETYRLACGIAAKYGLDYHLHPCEGSLTVSTDSFLFFAEAVGAPNLMFNLDTANQFLIRDNLPLSLIRLKDRIKYIHISDNDGVKAGHFAPGEGNINWEVFFSVLREIDFNGKLAIDVGGAETPIADIDAAYKGTANWLRERVARGG
ncbi:sugar phosphate isomerase/epimerase family protein [Dyadobacter bucti]|uniref:sugar phosphate isomerase/epimerase family protein n=1 Tax=Dyadobacter bucti TaxID=2572203 RepID=UPI00110819F1|nr:sugar phosphate isomerase/epimerase [Dyadobacter bucti]